MSAHQVAAVTTHILDLDSGHPAVGVAVSLWRAGSDEPVTTGATDSDGRIKHWASEFSLSEGQYRLNFAIEPWFEACGRHSFYPQVDICFNVKALDQHYHVPLLLNAHGYSTYRGS